MGSGQLLEGGEVPREASSILRYGPLDERGPMSCPFLVADEMDWFASEGYSGGHGVCSCVSTSTETRECENSRVADQIYSQWLSARHRAGF